LSDKIKELETKHKTGKPITVTSDDVADTVARITGVPVTKVIRSEAKYLVNLEKNLGKYVIGQSEAVETVARAVQPLTVWNFQRKTPDWIIYIS
jgi:ATP-dependent Clp protease ATP-binding subunit ClpL